MSPARKSDPIQETRREALHVRIAACKLRCHLIAKLQQSKKILYFLFSLGKNVQSPSGRTSFFSLGGSEVWYPLPLKMPVFMPGLMPWTSYISLQAGGCS